MIDSKERFSNRVNNYLKYRPHYPEKIIEILQEKINLKKDWVIADIGSGTGFSSEIFLKNGNLVYGVEPNTEMRQAAEILLKQYEDFKSINGSAEKTNLENKSIDLIIAGQAFHWFNIHDTKIEFQRILKDRRYIVLFWNERKVNKNNFLIDYESILKKYGKDYEKIKHRDINEEVFIKFYGSNNYIQEILENYQYFDWPGLKGRLLSSSYIPLEGETGFTDMINELKLIYDKYKINDIIKFEYDTKIYVGQFE